MVLCKRARTRLCKREISFLHLDHQNCYFPDHQNCYYPSKRESTKQFDNSKIKFPLVYVASSQEEMLATLRIFLFHFAYNIA
ncbi:hypothetical protein RHGRI_037437 [Rhododendron griersonianum]|uniref:Uncharacterized protein n=1 Tax=Rhododendron griersonianum TaxID=479676 RepID=A0AAV6HV46_9ERIC|nr:hypothetical protein RHGRI_037437 [Rhododendron griersonianum]